MEDKVLLKDKSVTQPFPDIHRKLQNLVAKPGPICLDYHLSVLQTGKGPVKGQMTITSRLLGKLPKEGPS